ncbi:hypothetical protein [Yinghuangia soli]|uniref:Uncharacterized protein n=1 Tax=Yinghuangia soli TaxID=2908204 RepID=A0AA41U6Q7_9ACTN|nr:hypothetical protein [Yinghuangia soli]MCF2531209.1 hypothetical protein [Yinghuangia soli]
MTSTGDIPEPHDEAEDGGWTDEQAEAVRQGIVELCVRQPEFLGTLLREAGVDIGDTANVRVEVVRIEAPAGVPELAAPGVEELFIDGAVYGMRDALLTMMTVRELSLSPAQYAHVHGSRDRRELQNWIIRAAAAEPGDDVIGPAS